MKKEDNESRQTLSQTKGDRGDCTPATWYLGWDPDQRRQGRLYTRHLVSRVGSWNREVTGLEKQVESEEVSLN